MKRKPKLSDLTTEQLLALYTEIGVTQNAAQNGGHTARFNRLADGIGPIVKELAGRPGDQRNALLQLYDHPDIQVRLNAATDTWHVAQTESRRKLEEIRDLKWYPQCLPAGMNIRILDGQFEKKPR